MFCFFYFFNFIVNLFIINTQIKLKIEKKDLEKNHIAYELTMKEFNKLKIKFEKNNEILKKYKQRVTERDIREKRNK